MSPVHRALLTRIAALLVLAAAAALAFGLTGFLAALAAGLIVLLLSDARRLATLDAWARQPPGTPLPLADGIWGDVFGQLTRRTREAMAQRAELSEALDRFRLVAEALPDGVVILDEVGAIEWMSTHAADLLLLDRTQDIGVRLGQLVREPAFLDFLAATEMPLPLTLATGRTQGRTLEFRRAPFSVGQELLIVRDMTQLAKLETMRRDFVANCSHELKTPLTVTLGYLETAQDGLVDTPAETVAGYLEVAMQQAQHMRALIDDLLMLSSLETDAPPVESLLPVADLVAQVRAEAAALSNGRHEISLSCDPPDASSTALRGAERELHSALANLASNAVRYTPERGRIHLSWQDRADGGGIFCVEDSGIGIAPEHIGRLTERFYRVDRGRSRAHGGTGLGLAIVKHVLERHQARLEVDSEPGRGSSFRIVFPPQRIVRDQIANEAARAPMDARRPARSDRDIPLG